MWASDTVSELSDLQPRVMAYVAPSAAADPEGPSFAPAPQTLEIAGLEDEDEAENVFLTSVRSRDPHLHGNAAPNVIVTDKSQTDHHQMQLRNRKLKELPADLAVNQPTEQTEPAPASASADKPAQPAKQTPTKPSVPKQKQRSGRSVKLKTASKPKASQAEKSASAGKAQSSPATDVKVSPSESQSQPQQPAVDTHSWSSMRAKLTDLGAAAQLNDQSLAARWFEEQRKHVDTQDVKILMNELRHAVKEFRDATSESKLDLRHSHWFTLPTEREMMQRCERESSFIVSLEKQGMVKLFVDQEDGEDEGEVPLTEQGDLSFYTVQNIIERETLKFDTRLLDVVKLWWDTIPRMPPHFTRISKQQYMQTFRLVYYILVPSKQQQPHAQQQILEADWAHDSEGKDTLTFAMLHRVLFRLADHWTHTLDAEEYVFFLLKLLELITEKPDHKGDKLRWKRIPFKVDVSDFIYGRHDFHEDETLDSDSEGEAAAEKPESKATVPASESQPTLTIQLNGQSTGQSGSGATDSRELPANAAETQPAGSGSASHETSPIAGTHSLSSIAESASTTAKRRAAAAAAAAEIEDGFAPLELGELHDYENDGAEYNSADPASASSSANPHERKRRRRRRSEADGGGDSDGEERATNGAFASSNRNSRRHRGSRAKLHSNRRPRAASESQAAQRQKQPVTADRLASMSSQRTHRTREEVRKLREKERDRKHAAAGDKDEDGSSGAATGVDHAELAAWLEREAAANERMQERLRQLKEANALLKRRSSDRNLTRLGSRRRIVVDVGSSPSALKTVSETGADRTAAASGKKPTDGDGNDASASAANAAAQAQRPFPLLHAHSISRIGRTTSKRQLMSPRHERTSPSKAADGSTATADDRTRADSGAKASASGDGKSAFSESELDARLPLPKLRERRPLFAPVRAVEDDSSDGSGRMKRKQLRQRQPRQQAASENGTTAGEQTAGATAAKPDADKSTTGASPLQSGPSEASEDKRSPGSSGADATNRDSKSERTTGSESREKPTADDSTAANSPDRRRTSLTLADSSSATAATDSKAGSAQPTDSDKENELPRALNVGPNPRTMPGKPDFRDVGHMSPKANKGHSWKLPTRSGSDRSDGEDDAAAAHSGRRKRSRKRNRQLEQQQHDAKRGQRASSQPSRHAKHVDDESRQFRARPYKRPGEEEVDPREQRRREREERKAARMRLGITSPRPQLDDVDAKSASSSAMSSARPSNVASKAALEDVKFDDAAFAEDGELPVMDEKAVLEYLNELSSDDNDTDAEGKQAPSAVAAGDPQTRLQKDLRKKAVLYYLLERQRRQMPDQFPESFSLADVDLPSEVLRMKRADLMAIYGGRSNTGAFTFPLDYHFTRYGRRLQKRHRFSMFGPEMRRRKFEEWKQRQADRRKRWEENLRALEEERQRRIAQIQEKHGRMRRAVSDPRLLHQLHRRRKRQEALAEANRKPGSPGGLRPAYSVGALSPRMQHEPSIESLPGIDGLSLSARGVGATQTMTPNVAVNAAKRGSPTVDLSASKAAKASGAELKDQSTLSLSGRPVDKGVTFDSAIPVTPSPPGTAVAAMPTTDSSVRNAPSLAGPTFAPGLKGSFVLKRAPPPVTPGQLLATPPAHHAQVAAAADTASPAAPAAVSHRRSTSVGAGGFVAALSIATNSGNPAGTPPISPRRASQRFPPPPDLALAASPVPLSSSRASFPGSMFPPLLAAMAAASPTNAAAAAASGSTPAASSQPTETVPFAPVVTLSSVASPAPSESAPIAAAAGLNTTPSAASLAVGLAEAAARANKRGSLTFQSLKGTTPSPLGGVEQALRVVSLARGSVNLGVPAAAANGSEAESTKPVVTAPASSDSRLVDDTKLPPLKPVAFVPAETPVKPTATSSDSKLVLPSASPSRVVDKAAPSSEQFVTPPKVQLTLPLPSLSAQASQSQLAGVQSERRAPRGSRTREQQERRGTESARTMKSWADRHADAMRRLSSGARVAPDNLRFHFNLPKESRRISLR